MDIVFALVSLLGWGVGDIFVTIISRKLGNLQAYFLGFILAWLFASLYIPLAGGINDYGMFFLAFGLNIIHTFANLSYFKGLEVGNASLTGTVGGSFSFVAVFISVLIFGEKLTLFHLFGIGLIFAGITLASLNWKEMKTLKKHSILSDKGVYYGLLAMLGWGIYFSLIRIPAEKIGWYWSGYTLYLTLPFLLFLKPLENNWRDIFKDYKLILTLLMMVVLITAADFSYNLGILAGFTSTVAPIAGSYPIVFVVLSRFVFKEKLTLSQKSGIFLTLIGIVIISTVSG